MNTLPLWGNEGGKKTEVEWGKSAAEHKKRNKRKRRRKFFLVTLRFFYCFGRKKAIYNLDSVETLRFFYCFGRKAAIEV